MNTNKDLSKSASWKLLSHLTEPIVFKNILSMAKAANTWKVLDWSLEQVADEFGDLKLPFRVGKNEKTKLPQWDIYTPSESMTMKEFLCRAEETENLSQWFYFDYKYIKDFKYKFEIYNSLDWKLFGLDYGADKSTMWIGSKGAHTNCHLDTYGCNLVAQTHGRKLWLLFSPDCNNSMEPTRIPHEESTIFSKYNFFAPSKKEIEAIKTMPGCMKMIILEPQDVLFVPKGWWHYVECLDTSMSINIWLSLKTDCKDRLNEALVTLLSSTVGTGIPRPMNQPEYSKPECINYLVKCLIECQKFKQKDETVQKHRKLHWSDTDLLQELKRRYPDVISLLSDLTPQNIDGFLKKNDVFKDTDINTEENEVYEICEENKFILFQTVLDEFCHPEVISRISKNLMKKFIK